MSDASPDPSFEIPHPPERRYSRYDGLEYGGGTVFVLTPDDDIGNDELGALLVGVLDGETYTYGDWFDLPMALYLVHDTETGDVFRAAVRDGTIELHVLPETDPAGLRGLYRRLCATSDATWRVERRTDTE
ncbi:hypothetical protein [Halococcus saccharolyticus]|uniref:Uncharacterized protein n=1 Tax=Halococcus saccharolyticus DSM 5350 TaxID=1227455 RepID=M0MJ33_9EURY|nr:hypothetical protein [Halococcus saccharolyticus]EMA44445.1 hypothetical protein C449_10568 [Halococcus saccharolyticus DSM 5350]